MGFTGLYKVFGFACCGECSTMIPRPFGLGIFVVGGTGLAPGPACRSGRRASQFSRKKSNKKAVLPKQNCQVCDTG